MNTNRLSARAVMLFSMLVFAAAVQAQDAKPELVSPLGVKHFSNKDAVVECHRSSWYADPA